MSKRSSVWLCMIVIITAMFYNLAPMMAEQDSLYRMYAPLVEVDALIHREFVTTVRNPHLVDGAIRGAMLTLDPYSGYIARDEMQAFQRRSTGQYVGIGMEVGLVGGAMTVIAPIEGGPAERAGMHPGDTILAIDGRSTEELSVFDLEGRLAGRIGTQVVLRIRRPGGAVSDVRVSRGPVSRRAVKGTRRGAHGGWDFSIDNVEGVGYVRVSRFCKGMIQDFDAALGELVSRGVTALVLDLRFNAGGLLPEAVAMVDRFLDRGVILSTVTRRNAVRTYTATRKGTHRSMRLAVLVNAGSASSSEIVAGSLQDHGRAVIVGERTFGKGSVQNFFRLQGGLTGVKLTVAHYQLPSGRIIHKTPENSAGNGWGVIPNVVVPLDKGEYDAIRESRTEVDQSVAKGTGDDPSSPDTDRARPKLLIDRQLWAALDAVREPIPEP